MKNLILLLLMLFFLTACQTHFPIVSQAIESEIIPCENNNELLDLAEIDYLLYANRMVDAMIEDHEVQKKLTDSRLKLLIQPVRYEHTSSEINMAAINAAIKNRIVRSGQFIIVNDESSSDVQLSAVFENKKIQANNCMESYEQFSMQLKNSRPDRMIWTNKKQFK